MSYRSASRQGSVSARRENARVELHVHEWGDADAPPVVCLHGVVAHGRRFRRLAEERLASRFHVLAPDLRGHGRSTWEPPWTVAQHVSDVRELLTERGISRATVIGHSFGGRLAMELAALGLVERAVWLEPAIWIPPPIALERAEIARVPPSFASAEEAVAQRLATAPLPPRAFLEEERVDHLVEDEDGRWHWRYCASAVVSAYGDLAQPPPEWERVRVPTLVVVGAETDVVPEPMLEAITDGLRGSAHVVVVPGGHLVLWDAFGETADAVERFLR
jgi:lipase